jgi:riboflavin kinase/FMN adenylyltransferase
MQIQRQFNQPHGDPIVIAAGCFDGVHRGHQAVIRAAVDLASEQGGEAWVLTFDPHPARFLNPNAAPPLLSSQAELFRQFEQLGISGVFLIPFTREFSNQPPETFAADLLAALPNLGGFVTGTDWQFGRRSDGNVALLRELWKTSPVQIISVPAVIEGSARVSSTRIRHAILEGNLAEAEQLLGRPFSVFGEVVTGRQIGRDLGFPTANIAAQSEVEPPPGIYAARVRFGQKTHAAAAYIGSRRTFHNLGDERVLEVHLLDFDGDLYGATLEVQFIEKIRDDLAFESVDALKKQIALDLRAIRRITRQL